MSSAVESVPRVVARTWDRLGIIAWSLVAIVTAMRAVAAFSVPLIGDEGYYWEWARHLALGYGDHPPGVAYTIAAFSWLGTTPFAVRVGFILCGVLATILAAKTATRLANGDVRAGSVTALAITLTPLASVTFGSASPDGPYLAAWAASPVLLGARVRNAPAPRLRVARHRARRALAHARPGDRARIRRRDVRARAGAALPLARGSVAVVPGCGRDVRSVSWFGIRRTAGRRSRSRLVSRHAQDWKWNRPISLFLVEAAAYSPGLWVGALASIFYVRNAFLNWTAVPLVALLTLLAVHEPVEIHWVFGAYLSLCVSLGIVFVRLSARVRVIWASIAAVPALILFPLIFVAAVEPGFVYEQFLRTGSTLRNTGGFEIFTVPSLALDVRNMMEANDATVVTDGYGLSSTLDFYGNVPPVVIGYNPQGQEAKRWYDPDMQPHRILFVDKEALVPRPGHPEDKGRPEFVRQLSSACTNVVAGPTLGYEFHDSSGHIVPGAIVLYDVVRGPKTARVAHPAV